MIATAVIRELPFGPNCTLKEGTWCLDSTYGKGIHTDKTMKVGGRQTTPLIIQHIPMGSDFCIKMFLDGDFENPVHTQTYICPSGDCLP